MGHPVLLLDLDAGLDNLLLSIENTFNLDNLLFNILNSGIEIYHCLPHVVNGAGAPCGNWWSWSRKELNRLGRLSRAIYLRILELHLLARCFIKHLLVGAVATWDTAALHHEARPVRGETSAINANAIQDLLHLWHLLDAIEITGCLRVLLAICGLLKRDLILTNSCLLLIDLLSVVVNDQLLRNVLAQNEDTIFLGDDQLGFTILGWVCVDIGILVVSSTRQSIEP